MNMPTARLFRFLLLPILFTILCPSFAQGGPGQEEDISKYEVTITEANYDLLCIDIWMAMLKTYSEDQRGKNGNHPKYYPKIDSLFEAQSFTLLNKLPLPYPDMQVDFPNLPQHLQQYRILAKEVFLHDPLRSEEFGMYTKTEIVGSGKKTFTSYAKAITENLKDLVLHRDFSKDELLSELLIHNEIIEHFGDNPKVNPKRLFKNHLITRIELFFKQEGNVREGPEDEDIVATMAAEDGARQNINEAGGEDIIVDPPEEEKNIFLDYLIFWVGLGALIIVVIVLSRLKVFKTSPSKQNDKARNTNRKAKKDYPNKKKDDVKHVSLETQITPQTKSNLADKNHGGLHDTNTEIHNNNGSSSNSSDKSDSSGGKANPLEKKIEEQPIPQPKPKQTILYLKSASSEGKFPEAQSVLNETHHIAKLTLLNQDATEGAFDLLPSAEKMLVSEWDIFLIRVADIRPESSFDPKGKLLDIKPGIAIKEGTQWKVKQKAKVTIK